MANHFAPIIVILLSLFCILEAFGSEPYCDRNETSIRYEPVIKTRTEVKPPTGVFKMFKKKKTQIVSYVEQEEHIQWKIISGCCDGYRMSPELRICEAHCSQGCAQHARCVEPNRCECKKGYNAVPATMNRPHHCEPICESDCPANARCAAPNVCDCLKGYHTEAGKCIEKIAETIASTTKFPPNTAETVKQQFGSTAETVEKFESTADTVHESSTEEAIVAEEEENPLEMDLDENEKIYLSSPSTVTYEDASEIISSTKCSVGFIFYNGECREQISVSTELDCRIQACTENSICQTNGSCTCTEGYVWHRTGTIEFSRAKHTHLDGSGLDSDDSSEEEFDDAENLDPVFNGKLVCISLLEFRAIYLQNSDAEDGDGVGDSDGDGWLGVFLVGLGVAIIVSATVLLGFKLFGRHSGELDVEAKNDLCCAYDNKQQILVL